MRHRFFETAFTGPVKAEQERHGSRASYARLTGTSSDPDVGGEVLGEQEIAFISARDSFYIGTVSEAGWPYVQHRGGPTGFVRILGDRTVGWADFTGNRQYVSLGNVATNDCVALFFMDYPARTRLKLLGRMTSFEIADRPDFEGALKVAGSTSRIEHAIVIEVQAFDWNCPQHIVPRYTVEEVEQAMRPLQTRVEELEARLSRALAGKTGNEGADL